MAQFWAQQLRIPSLTDALAFSSCIHGSRHSMQGCTASNGSSLVQQHAGDGQSIVLASAICLAWAFSRSMPYCAASAAFILLPWHSQMDCPSCFCKLRREFCWQCCGMQRQGRGYSDCLTKAPLHCCSHEQQAKTTKAQAYHTMHLGVQDSKLCLTVTAGGSMPGAMTVWTATVNTSRSSTLLDIG